MNLSDSVTTCLSFLSIWKVTSQSMLSYTLNYEQKGTPIVGIDDLRGLRQIIRPILARIHAAACCSGSAII